MKVGPKIGGGIEPQRSPEATARAEKAKGAVPVAPVRVGFEPDAVAPEKAGPKEPPWGPNGIMRQLARVRADTMASMQRLETWNAFDAALLELFSPALDDTTRLGRFLAMADIARLRRIDTFALDEELFLPTDAQREVYQRALASLAQSPLWHEPELRVAAIEAALELGLGRFPAADPFAGLPNERIPDLAMKVLAGPWKELHDQARAALGGVLAPGIRLSGEVSLQKAPPLSTEEWIDRSDAALDPITARRPEPKRAAPSPSSAQKALEDFASLFSGPMYRYSVEEIRRALVSKHPFLSKEYVAENIVPRLRLLRDVDRYGPEPHFLFAVHLARFMLGASPGTTEDDVVRRFFADPNLRARFAWNGYGAPVEDQPFTPADLERLREAYPFIPRWNGGTKPEGDLMLGDTADENRPPDHLSQTDYRAWKTWKSVDERIQKYGSVPMVEAPAQQRRALPRSVRRPARRRAHRGELRHLRRLDAVVLLDDEAPPDPRRRPPPRQQALRAGPGGNRPGPARLRRQHARLRGRSQRACVAVEHGARGGPFRPGPAGGARRGRARRLVRGERAREAETPACSSSASRTPPPTPTTW